MSYEVADEAHIPTDAPSAAVIPSEATDTEAIDVRDRISTIEISAALLADLLHMPPQMRINEVSLNPGGRSVSVWVSHPSLPKVEDGDEIPVLMPIFTYEARPVDDPTLLAADWGPDLGVHRTRL